MDSSEKRAQPPPSISPERTSHTHVSPSLLSPEFQPTIRFRRRSPSATQPKLTFATPPEPRRQSLPENLPERSTKPSFRSKSPSPPRGSDRRTSSRGSPPPPSAYENRVSFDTFDNPDAVDFSLTLRAKHLYYESTSNSRTFLFGFDRKDYSEDALEWLFEELIEDGDEIICLRVIDKDNRLNNSVNLENQEYRAEAHALMKMIQDKTDEDKSVSLVLEFAVGKVQNVIRSMTKIYEPTCLVVGTRGRPKHGFKNLFPGSISRDCLQNSLVPVLVIPPSAKREKKKLKRQAKPSRRSYMEIVERSDAAGSLTLSSFERGRSRDPHPVGETIAGQEAESIAPVSDTAIQPRRATTTITPIPEEVESPVPSTKHGVGHTHDSSPRDGSGDDTTPLASPKDPGSPDIPILRVNSEDIL